jgi:hypothetical protein
MNTLEDRVRQALAERAAHSPISPDAWDKTVARAGRRRVRLTLPRWLPSGLLIPACAAATVVAVVLGSLALAGGRTTASHGSTPSGGEPAGALPATVRTLLRSNPAFTAVVPVTFDSVTIYFWYSSHSGSTRLCAMATAGPYPGDGSCQLVPVSLLRQPAFFTDVAGDNDGFISYGGAATRVTSVTTKLTKTGQLIAGRIVSGRGFPREVWLATIPSLGTSATAIFRDAAGREIAHLDNTMTISAQLTPAKGGITVDGWTAYLIDGKVTWFGPPDVPVEHAIPRTVKQAPLMVFFQAVSSTNYAVGYAPADVARLELRFPDGKTYAAPTVSGWPGSGTRLWVRSGLPMSGIPQQTLVISYNAAGQVIARQTIASLPSG